MEEREVFVYWIKDGKIIKDICVAKPKTNSAFTLKGYRRQPQTIYYADLDICVRNRVISFEDNCLRFKQMIIDDMEIRIAETTKRLKQQVDLLNSIKK